MAKPLPATELKGAPPFRKYLYSIFGNAAFAPHFHLALAYYDAVLFSQGVRTVVKRPWDKHHPGTPLARIHVAIMNQEEVVGIRYSLEIARLLTVIATCSKKPKSQIKMAIYFTYTHFRMALGRYPTFEELRFWTWFSQPKGGQNPPPERFAHNEVSEKTRDGWRQAQNETAVPLLPRQSSFQRTAKEMGLKLTDALLLERFRELFTAMDCPNAENFIVEANLQIVPRFSHSAQFDLEQATLDDLVEFLLNPHAPGEYWKGAVHDWNVRSLELLERPCGDLDEAKRGRFLAQAFRRLGIALELREFAVFSADDPSSLSYQVEQFFKHHPPLPTFPTVAECIFHLNLAELKVLTGCLEMTENESLQFLQLSKDLKEAAADAPMLKLACLKAANAELDLLMRALKPFFQQRLSAALWFEFADRGRKPAV
jgi:hypothetical protein